MRLLALLSLALLSTPLAAQSTAGAVTAAPAPSAQEDERAVLAVVQRTFDAMKGRDSTMFRSVFAPGARIVSTFTDRQGKPAMRELAIDRFAAAVAGFKEDVVERIFDPKVQIVDNLATVIADYDLHAGGRFSHCGVDAFHLARTEAGWKIVHITDTQRREGCPERPAP